MTFLDLHDSSAPKTGSLTRVLLVITVCPMFNAGCVVLAIEGNGDRRIATPPLITERAKLDCNTLDDASSPTRGMQPEGITRQQLKEAWGSPDGVEIAADIERWTYKTDWRWNGFWGIFVIVPVPLIFPTGHEKMIVEFSSGVVRSVEVHYQVGRVFGCGFAPIHGGGWKCGYEGPNHYYGLHSSFCGYGKKF